MELKNLRIETNDSFAYLKATVVLRNKEEEMFFAVEKEFESALDNLSYDAFLIGNLFNFMEEGGTLKIQGGISERLAFQIQHYFSKCLLKYIPHFKPIEIQATHFTKKEDYHPFRNITGVSGGVDSFYTIFRKQNPEVSPNYRLNSLAYFLKGDPQFYDKKLMKNSSEIISHRLNLPSIKIWTNLLSFVETPFEGFSTYFNLACINSIKKEVKNYWMASGSCTDEGLRIHYEDCSGYDPLLCSHLTTETLEVCSDDFYTDRLEKTQFISNFPVVREHLDVCLHPTASHEKNCSRCGKCIRTMFQLEVLGVLDKFHAVFDLAHFKKHRQQYLGYFWYYCVRNKLPFYKEILAYQKKNKSSKLYRTPIFWGAKTGWDNQVTKVKALLKSQ